jgi:hypothetical protein
MGFVAQGLEVHQQCRVDRRPAWPVAALATHAHDAVSGGVGLGACHEQQPAGEAQIREQGASFSGEQA